MSTQKQQADYLSCYAYYEENELVIGNECIERRWKLENGLLFPTSLYDRITPFEWMARPSTMPVPYPDQELPEEARQVQVTIDKGKQSTVEASSLSVTVIARGKQQSLRYIFTVFPDTPGIRMNMCMENSEEMNRSTIDTEERGRDATEDVTTMTGVETPLINQSFAKNVLPRIDSLEYLDLAATHIRFRQIEFRDQTDIHNELVFEKEWLLHPNESHIKEQGNVFVLENTLTNSGLIFLKEAPLPEERPHGNEYDVHLRGGTASVFDDKWEVPYGKEHAAYPHTYRCAFYGHGLGQCQGSGYRYVLLSYTGGRSGQIEALHTYQRQLREYDIVRDGQFLSNTWGDRSADGRISESFLQKEIEAGHQLGVDIVQIDDGWEVGRTSNSVEKGGVWYGFWEFNPNFWEVDLERLPNGLTPLLRQARSYGMQFGLWFAPDKIGDYKYWKKDAQKIIELHQKYDVNYFKMDSIHVESKFGEINLKRLFDYVLAHSNGKVVFDLDITAGVRPGYFGLINVGPLFVQNRYTDWRRYWPHQTLRNVWKLAQYVDPLRLRMEVLNPYRNTNKYVDDPLGPVCYSPAYLFATVMFCNPLGWFEVSNLPESYVQDMNALVQVWKEHRAAMFHGHIHPIGEVPDGTSWTGFASVAKDRQSAYVLVLREYTNRDKYTLSVPTLTKNACSVELLSGEGTLEVEDGTLRVHISTSQSYVFGRIIGEVRK